MENREEIEWFKKRRDGSPMAGARKMFDMAIAALEKLDAIQTCTPPSDDWEHYADRLHDIAYQSGYEQGKKDAEQDRWNPCSERMPTEPFGCFVTVMDTNPITQEEFENILPYFVGWDGEQWNDADGERTPFEVLAWLPLPKPYKLEEET